MRITAAVALAGALAVAAPQPARAGPAVAGNEVAQSQHVSAGVSRSGQPLRRPVRSIPDAALLQAEDLHGAVPSPATGEYWSTLQPPQPCTDGPYRSTALRRADRGIMALVDVDGSPEVVMEHVAIYRGNGAHKYLRELRRAIAACDTSDPQEAVWTVLATGVAGDESMLLSLRTYVDYADTYHYTYVLVARVGRALVVLADVGWETASGNEALVREFSTKAVQRAAILNRR
jgi:hypothetical protein